MHEAGLAFRGHKVDLSTHRLDDGNDYKRINVHGYVPALVLDDGTLLTENVALLDWIADQGESLAPAGRLRRTQNLQMLAFVSTELQKPFVGLFFTESESERLYLREVLEQRLNWVGARMKGEYMFGDRFTASDAFVYVMLRWADMAGVEIPDDLLGLARRAERRDAVKSVLITEGVKPLHGPLSR